MYIGFNLILYIPDLILMSILMSLLHCVEALQHIVGEVLLVLSLWQLDYRSGLFTCLFVDSYQTEPVLNSCFLTFLASLGTLGAMDPFDDPNDVLMFLCSNGHVKNEHFLI